MKRNQGDKSPESHQEKGRDGGLLRGPHGIGPEGFAQNPPVEGAGHLGNGHPHQNFVARDPAEVARFEQVVERTLRDVIAMGGTVAAEHGIGKIKSRWLPLQMRSSQIAVMRALKAELDPNGIMAPGNILA